MPASSLWRTSAALLTAAVILYIISLLGPVDVMSRAQHRTAAYVMDAVWHGNWLIQYDLHGEITSKPPLYTWLAAGCAVLFGGINRFTLTLPAAAATAGLAILVALEGRRRFDALTGALAGWFVLLSPLAMKLIAISRLDMLFAFLVTAGAIVALRACETGRGWTPFWLIMAAAVLTKGPLALVLVAMGLMVIAWERYTGDNDTLRLRGNHWMGVGLFLLIALGWFGLAWLSAQSALTDKMLRDELINQAVGKDSIWNLTRLLKPALYFTADALPWSILTGIGLWRIWKHPPADPQHRRFLRFSFYWFVGGLTLFSLATHQRADLLTPLLAPAGWIAAREAVRIFSSITIPMWRRIGFGATVAAGLFLAVYQEIRGTQNHRIALSVEMRQLAREVRPHLDHNTPLYSIDAPFAFQFYMESANPMLSVEDAVAVLTQYPAPVIAVSEQYPQLRQEAEARGIPLTEIATWPDIDNPTLRLITRGLPDTPPFDSSEGNWDDEVF